MCLIRKLCFILRDFYLEKLVTPFLPVSQTLYFHQDKRNRDKDTGTYEETHQPVDFLTPPLLLSMSCTEAEEWTFQQS